MSGVYDLMTVLETLLLAAENSSAVKYFSNTAALKGVDIGDYAMLDKGVSYAAVILPGKFVDEEGGSYYNQTNYDILIDLFCRYSSDAGTNWNTFSVFRDDIVEHLTAYPTMNNTTDVVRVGIIADEDPTAVMKGTSEKNQVGPVFLLQRIRLNVTVRKPLSDGEYAA